MEFLGIGPFELVIILLIALLVMGPKDMKKAGLTLGRMLRQLVTSPTWATLQQMMRELRFLPNRLMREAGMEEEELRNIPNEIRGSIPRTDELHQALGLEYAQRELNETRSDLKQWQADISDVDDGLQAWTSYPKVDRPASPPPADPPPFASEAEAEDSPS